MCYRGKNKWTAAAIVILKAYGEDRRISVHCGWITKIT